MSRCSRRAPRGRRSRRISIFAALSFVIFAASAQAELPELSDLVGRDVWGKAPTVFAWSPDGQRLAYIWADSTGEALWVREPQGEEAAVLRPKDLATQGGDSQAPVSFETLDGFEWLPDGSGWVVQAGDDLFVFNLAQRTARRLTQTTSAEESPKVAPTGDRIGFVRDHDLWVVEISSGREQRLTSDGKADTILNGETDWVYWEEIWDRDATGFWWSPDGQQIAYYRFDDSALPTHPLLDDAPRNPTVRHQKYPKPGDPNPIVQVGVVEIASGATTWMETGEKKGDDYLVRVDWSARGEWLGVQRLNRDQTELDLLRCDPQSGRCRPLASEKADAWINLSHDFHALPNGGFLWSREESGWRRLELFDAAGRLVRSITPEGWCHAGTDAVLADGRIVFTAYRTSGLGASERHIFRAKLDGGAPEALTSGGGWHAATVAATGAWIDQWSDADTPARLTLYSAEGAALPPLPSSPPKIDPALFPKWRRFEIPGPDGSKLAARLLEPAGIDPTKRYPVLIYHYGGPASQVVVDRWGARDAWHKWMALRGYAVFSVDNQASLFFGKRGEVKVHRQMGEIELAGQLAGVEYLKTLPWVDSTRLGLWGWSGGGTNTLYSLFHRPRVWRAGVAGAPVTDWHLYDSIWTERYLDRPDGPNGNAVGFSKSSPINAAANLQDALLIVHGTADDNVHPQNSWNLIRKLQEAKVSYEDMTLPGQTHAVRGDGLLAFYRRMTEFFDRWLTPAR